MHRVGQGTRQLPPLTASGPDEIVGPEMAFAGSVAQAHALPLPAVALAAQPAVDLPPVEHGTDWEPSPVPIEGQGPSIISHGAPALGRGIERPHFVPATPAESLDPARPQMVAFRDAGGDAVHAQEAQNGRPELDGDDTLDSDDVLSELGNIDGIDISQVATADQDASVIVNGYVGNVVTRLHIDQNLVMDQDADISVTIDGDGHFVVLLDQDMRIDQDVRIDVDIFDVDGVLYVDLFLRDSIEIEQDTIVDARIGDGPPGGTVEVTQTIEMDQDVDIDIDIEDELEERYLVKVDVSVEQKIDAEQDAVVDIRDLNGEVDMDLDAIQAASVDQQTIVQADLVLI